MFDLRTYPRRDELPTELEQWLTPAPIDPGDRPSASPEQRDAGDADQGTGAVHGWDGSSLPPLGPLAGFGSWPSVASTIMNATCGLSYFDPASTGFFGQSWIWFWLKFMLCPFWNRNFYSDTQNISITKTSLKPALDSIVDFVRPLGTDSFVDEVSNSVRKIAQLAVENRGYVQKDNQQQLGVISVRSSLVYITCFRVSIAMEYRTGKGYEQLNQSISLVRSYGILDYDYCWSNADVIENMDRSSVDQWGNDISSGGYPPNQSPAWGV